MKAQAQTAHDCPSQREHLDSVLSMPSPSAVRYSTSNIMTESSCCRNVTETHVAGFHVSLFA
jgi:hypothetical protein